MQRYCLALDLKDDPVLIQEYKDYHTQVWPEIEKSIRDSGIMSMEIYLFSNRLFMIIDTDKHFSFERKTKMDRENGKVQEWENLMWKYQEAIPGAKPGEKWVLMDKIFQLQ